jgi:hypothetical protein
MLAYAAQGVSGHAGAGSGGQLRELMSRAVAALDGLADAARAGATETDLREFLELVEADARRASIAMRVVLARPAMSSQLVDNLNASLHLRTLLTDLFLLDELVAPS